MRNSTSKTPEYLRDAIEDLYKRVARNRARRLYYRDALDFAMNNRLFKSIQKDYTRINHYQQLLKRLNEDPAGTERTS